MLRVGTCVIVRVHEKAQGFMSLQDVLLRYPEKIVREWVHPFHTGISDRFSRRPLDELNPLVSEAVDASFSLLAR